MPKHHETKHLPYTPEKLFDLVADVERYPEFLPWVIGARVVKRDGPVIEAELIIGFKMIRERYTSRITLERPNRIDVTYKRGPFNHLENHWSFEADGDGCTLDFHLDFEFRSRLLTRVIGGLFNEAVRKMVSAFEARARRLYGKGGIAPLPSGRPA